MSASHLCLQQYKACRLLGGESLKHHLEGTADLLTGSLVLTLTLLFYLFVHSRYPIKLHANVMTAGHSLVTTQVHFNAVFLISAMPVHDICAVILFVFPRLLFLPSALLILFLPLSSFHLSSFSVMLHNWSFLTCPSEDFQHQLNLFFCPPCLFIQKSHAHAVQYILPACVQRLSLHIS